MTVPIRRLYSFPPWELDVPDDVTTVTLRTGRTMPAEQFKAAYTTTYAFLSKAPFLLSDLIAMSNNPKYHDMVHPTTVDLMAEGGVIVRAGDGSVTVPDDIDLVARAMADDAGWDDGWYSESPLMPKDPTVAADSDTAR